MRTPPIKKLVSGGLGLVVVACLWLTFAPAGLGGSTTYVTTDGISMEPRFHAGDLALVRSQGSYHVGEIVAYHSKVFDTIVLHRIVGLAGSRYVFKGDNNNFADFEHVARSQLIGALWLRIPGAGARLESIRSPALVGALVAVGILLFAGAVFTQRRRRRRRQRRAAEGVESPPRRLPQIAAGPTAGILAIGLAALLPFVALALLAFTRPSTALMPLEIPYQQSGKLSYTATATPGPTYAGGRAVTGEPLFTRVINTVALRFEYLFHTAAAHALLLNGRASLYVTVASTSGWQTTFQLGQTTRFHGDHAHVTATLDLTSLLALVHRVETTTAVSGSYTLTLSPHVSASGSVDAVPVHATFSPQTQFSLSPLELQPAVAAGGSAAARPSADPFAPSTSGSATTRRYQPLFLSLKLARLSVETARRIAIGAIAIIISALLTALAFVRPGAREESAAIRARYGRLIVPVERVWQLPGVAVIDVADMDALVRIAEHYERSILHETTDDGDAFWVTDESGQFRYALGAPGYAGDDALADRSPAPDWVVGEVYIDEQGQVVATSTTPPPDTMAAYAAIESDAVAPDAAVAAAGERDRRAADKPAAEDWTQSGSAFSLTGPEWTVER